MENLGPPTLIFIDSVALAKQEDNALGSAIRLSVRLRALSCFMFPCFLDFVRDPLIVYRSGVNLVSSGQS